MAFCPNCGKEAQGTFCANCGSQLAGAAAQGGGAAPPPPPQAAQAAGMEENVASALCYLVGILTGILFLVLEPYNKNRTVRFHAFQSIFFGIGMFVCYMVILVMGFIPFIGWLISLISAIILPLTFVVLWLLLMYKAYNNQMWKLPIIGDLAEKQV